MRLGTGARIGPYEIVALLGAGGMGEVYRARDTRLAREVAIKVLPDACATDAERLRRFEDEARAAGQLNHPNILTVYDVGTQEGVPYIVAELLEGETLRSRLEQGTLTLRTALDYAHQIAEGLAAAHDKGIVHRDLKPDNLFITIDGRIKILDFGLAKLTRPSEEASGSSGFERATETLPGVVLGTVGYMSPEQVRGEAADHRSDLFSFGAVLYEMLTGRAAFIRGTAADTWSPFSKKILRGLHWRASHPRSSRSSITVSRPTRVRAFNRRAIWRSTWSRCSPRPHAPAGICGPGVLRARRRLWSAPSRRGFSSGINRSAHRRSGRAAGPRSPS